MKQKVFYLLWLAIFMAACEEDQLLFEKSADERAAEAISNLRNELIQPENGWRLLYRPNNEAGLYNVILKFNEDGKVNIQTDLSVNDGEFHNQTIPYRIDNSLSLELIFETYSFFSFLFELNQTDFGGEFEFEFVNKTPDNALVFVSKTDRVPPPTRLVLIPATPNPEQYLSKEVSQNINSLSSASNLFNPPLSMNFEDKDLAFNIKLDDISRTAEVSYVYRKSDLNNGQVLDFSSGYLLQGDSLIFEEPLTGSFDGEAFEINAIIFDNLEESTTEFCAGNVTDGFIYHGTIPGSNDKVSLEPTLFDIKGKNVFQNRDFFISQVIPTSYIIDGNDSSAAPQIVADIAGVQDMQLYYFDDENPFFALGFRVQNSDATNTWLLKRFLPEFEGNKMKFDFADTISVFGNQNYSVNVANIDKYLNLLTEQDNTYIIEINENFYEFYNPCNGWRFIFSAF